MMDFVAWLLPNVCDFLLTPPISAFVGIYLLFWVLRLIGNILTLNKPV